MFQVKSYLQKYILFLYVKNICTSRRMTQAGCSLRLQFCSTKLGGFSTLLFLSTFLHANRFDADELRSTGLCAAVVCKDYIKVSLCVSRSSSWLSTRFRWERRTLTISKLHSDRHPVSREVLKFMFWKVPMAGWPQLWLATARAEPWNFGQHS